MSTSAAIAQPSPRSFLHNFSACVACYSGGNCIILFLKKNKNQDAEVDEGNLQSHRQISCIPFICTPMPHLSDFSNSI